MRPKTDWSATDIRLRNIFKSMKQRCHYPKSIRYNAYGARGIKVCEDWRKDFKNFERDMYASYIEHVNVHGLKNTTIERMDVDGDYTPDNCKWETPKNQMRNMTNTRWIEHEGNKISLIEYAEITGQSYDMVRGRASRGWNDEQIKNNPVRKLSKRMSEDEKKSLRDLVCYEILENNLSFAEISRKHNIPRMNVQRSIKPIEKTNHELYAKLRSIIEINIEKNKNLIVEMSAKIRGERLEARLAAGGPKRFRRWEEKNK